MDTVQLVNLLRERLSSKMDKSEIDALVKEVESLSDVNRSESYKNLKNNIDYIDYKCREIIRALHMNDRHVRAQSRERSLFRDRSPLGLHTRSLV
jgi:hypothetical protein